MAKIVLDDVASGFNLQKINANFEAIQNELNNKTLYRDNPEGEANSMENTLDMNGNDLINVGTLSVSNLDISGVNLDEQIALALAAADEAEQSALDANAALGDIQLIQIEVDQDRVDAEAAVVAAEAAAQDAIDVVAAVDPPTIVRKDSDTGAARVPAGTTAQRPVSPQAGDTRFNTTLLQDETYTGTIWQPSGQGATGAVGNPIMYENDITVTGNYTLTTGKNAMSAGPITVNSGVTVTVPSGQVWTIV